MLPVQSPGFTPAPVAAPRFQAAAPVKKTATPQVQFGHCGLEGPALSALASGLSGVVLAPMTRLFPNFSKRHGLDKPEAREKFNKRFNIFAPLAIGLSMLGVALGPITMGVNDVKPERISKSFQELYYGQDAAKYQLNRQIPESLKPVFDGILEREFPTEKGDAANLYLKRDLNSATLSNANFDRLVDAATPEELAKIDAEKHNIKLIVPDSSLLNLKSNLEATQEVVSSRVSDAELGQAIQDLPIDRLDRQKLTGLMTQALELEKELTVNADGLGKFDERFMKLVETRFADSFSKEELKQMADTAKAVQLDFEGVEKKEPDLQWWRTFLLIVGGSFLTSAANAANMDQKVQSGFKKLGNKFRKNK